MRPLSKTHHRILDAMRQHARISERDFDRSPTLDGGDEFTRLAARIGELREHGYAITTTLVTTSRGKRYATYSLDDVRPLAAARAAAPEPIAPHDEDADLALFDPAAAAPAARSVYDEDSVPA